MEEYNEKTLVIAVDGPDNAMKSTLINYLHGHIIPMINTLSQYDYFNLSGGRRVELNPSIMAFPTPDVRKKIKKYMSSEMPSYRHKTELFYNNILSWSKSMKSEIKNHKSKPNRPIRVNIIFLDRYITSTLAYEIFDIYNRKCGAEDALFRLDANNREARVIEFEYDDCDESNRFNYSTLISVFNRSKLLVPNISFYMTPRYGSFRHIAKMMTEMHKYGDNKSDAIDKDIEGQTQLSSIFNDILDDYNYRCDRHSGRVLNITHHPAKATAGQCSRQSKVFIEDQKKPLTINNATLMRFSSPSNCTAYPKSVYLRALYLGEVIDDFIKSALIMMPVEK